MRDQERSIKYQENKILVKQLSETDEMSESVKVKSESEPLVEPPPR
jgi:hypothetical protein